jgi:hypothetical protein
MGGQATHQAVHGRKGRYALDCQYQSLTLGTPATQGGKNLKYKTMYKMAQPKLNTLAIRLAYNTVFFDYF